MHTILSISFFCVSLNSLRKHFDKFYTSITVFFFLLQNFVGNNDRNTEIKNILYEGVLTRYVRFLPTSNHTKVCIRVEIFGVKKKPGLLKGDLVSKPKHATVVEGIRPCCYQKASSHGQFRPY